MKFPIALQPYTIREEMAQDYAGSLEKVAAIGYKGVELSTPPEGMSVGEVKQILERTGLQVIGAHCSLEQLTSGLDELSAYLHEVGGTYAALSYKFDSKQHVLEMAKRFNEIGENCRKHQIQFLYHNHNWEFDQFDGESVLDILLRETDPELVKLELDVYWVKRAGIEPADYLRKLKDRCPLLHIKDMEAGEEQFFAEIGEGILDFREIASVAEEIGTKWLVVEQDLSRRAAMESIAISYRNLGKLDLIQE
ncbi:sugar phosphate isomerase/epimerase family protein [Paenibacillus nasutitermitis]|uniref:Sugar phosphate isomerase n=1 Tax=Paenibacillus nasutitermitis TaxID=1652958 RepID=A0A917DRI4_9BACL|nr:sugar phosphate isomerase/epimerase [Paenibacillus nasutitermitis]GGD63107.1 sugar phosphate isomerase [Paenibacillus nasutitermitis]